MSSRVLAPLIFAAISFVHAQDETPPDGPRPLSAFLERFPESDGNGDGKLTAEELRSFQEKRRTGDGMQERLEASLKRFPQADVDKDGELTMAEWRAFQAAGEEMEQPRRARPERAAREPAPFPDVAYGEHEKQRFDVWPVPDATGPTPLVVFIHGGGFRSGDKASFPPNVIESYHQAGVAFAAMNYRLSDVGTYPMMMEDAARGLQTLRHRASEWNIDPTRIACYGGSAGAGISLWLAFHDDLADPDSSDPVARESTRIVAAGTMNGQSTYDMHTFREWFGIPDLSIQEALTAFYRVESDADLERPEIKAMMKDASPITHLSADDQVSVYMTYSRPNERVTTETDSMVWVHHPLLGLKLQEAMKTLGLECRVSAPELETEEDPYGSLEAFLIAKLKG